MRRTIQISDKYKDMIDKYELDLSKEEFSFLITKLLKANQELESKDMNIFLICELIDKYNLDFFSLINLVSNYSISAKNLNEPNEIEIKEEKELEEYKVSPLINLDNKVNNKTINKAKKTIEDKTKNIVVEDKKNTEIFNEEFNQGKNEVIKDNDVVKEEVDNPILSLGIDLF